MELLQQEAQEKKIKKKNQKTLSVAASSCSGLGLTLNCILMVKKKKVLNGSYVNLHILEP